MGRFFPLFLVLLLPLCAVSQNAPTPQLEPRPAGPSLPTPVDTSRQITLDVQVTDKSGAPIRGLQKQDFTLLDAKQPENIVSFHAVDGGAAPVADPPVEILLVVDAVNASFQAVAYERDKVQKFLLQNGGKLTLPVSLIIFSDTGAKVLGESSRDGKALAALYDQYEVGLRSSRRSQGFYGAEDRFSLSLKTLTSLTSDEGTRPGRKLMIWISPGWPLLSGPRVELSSKDQERIFNSIVDASTVLRLARITLYSVDPLGVGDEGVGRFVYYKEFLKGATSASRVLPGDLSLQVLAVQSGGRVLNSSNDLTTEIANCAADGDAFYVLSFNTSRADQANEYHSLEVKVDKPGVTARTRTGYYAQP